MAINLSIEADISLAEIQAAQQDGMSVVRTSHTGNNRDYNLAVAAAGIMIQAVDHTIVAQLPSEPDDEPKRDKNYYPGSVITASSITPLDIDRVDGLTMQTIATDPATGQRVTLDQLHTESLRKAFPGTKIVTNTEYIRAAETISGEVLRISLATLPELFRRVVESDGSIRRSPDGTSFTSLVRSYGILQLSDDPHNDRGVLIPNEVDIVLGFVVEAIEHGGNTQLHLSGPDFINYSKDAKLRSRLSTLYEAIREQASFGKGLPEILHVKIVPATAACFVAAKGNGAVLEHVFTVLADDAAIDEDKRRYFTSHEGHGQATEQFLAETYARKAEINRALSGLAMNASGLFIGSRGAPYLSQYDVLAAGGLFVAHENMHLSMRELEAIRRRLEKSREYGQRGSGQ